MRPSAALLTFSKPPLRGQVKTRLEPVLGQAGALELHRALLEDAVARLERLRDVADPWLYLAGPGDAAGACPVRLQCGGDLGERMARAFAECFAGGYRKVVIVGADSPTLPDALLRRAFSTLDESPAVIGPCEDGGYYLIGLSAEAPELFRDVDWGTERVLAQTRDRARALGVALVELPEWYDVDRPEDLARLELELAAAPPAEKPLHTLRFLQAAVPR